VSSFYKVFCCLLLLAITLGLAPVELRADDVQTDSLVIHVDARGGGDYTTLTAALQSAPSGATIQLAAGSHRLDAALDITRPVTLRGEGADQTEIVSAAEVYVVSVVTDGAFAALDLAFRHDGNAVADVVRVNAKQADLTRCRFEGAISPAEGSWSVGLQISGQTTAIVTSCVASGNAAVGIAVDGEVSAAITECECIGNTQVGIAVTQTASVTLTENLCSGNGYAGILLFGNSTGTVQGNTCSNNAGSGIVCTGDTASVSSA
jgi:parallel beta-helix repeat protein